LKKPVKRKGRGEREKTLSSNWATDYEIRQHALDRYWEKIRGEATEIEAKAAIRAALAEMLSSPESLLKKQPNGAWYYRYKQKDGAGGGAFTLVIRRPTNLSQTRSVVVTVLEPLEDGQEISPGSEIKKFIQRLNEELKELTLENGKLKQKGFLESGVVYPEVLTELEQKNTELEEKLRTLELEFGLTNKRLRETNQKQEQHISRLQGHIRMLEEHSIEARERYKRVLGELKTNLQQKIGNSNKPFDNETARVLGEDIERLDRRLQNLMVEIENEREGVNGDALDEFTSDIYALLKNLEDHPYTNGYKVHAMLEDILEKFKPGYKQSRDAIIGQTYEFEMKGN